MKEKRPPKPLIDHEVTIRAKVIDDAEETYTINASSMGEAIRIAIEKFEAEYREIIGYSIEVEV